MCLRPARIRLLVGLRQLDLPLDAAARLATMCAAGRCAEVSDELRESISRQRAEIQRRMAELHHVDERVALLERQLESGRQPQDAIGVERREA